MDHCLSYQLIRSKKRRRTISLHIKEDGSIFVYAPYRTPKWEIEKFINEKESWISEKLSEKERSMKKAEKGFLYLGELFPLELEDNKSKRYPLKLSFGKFILDKDHIEKTRDLFVQWYKREAREEITERVDYYSKRLLLFPKGIKITSAKSRWGSCSRDNRLSFSWRIITAPLSVIDYVLIHELVHIKEKNHSKSFWNYVESIIPNYKKHRLWLKENGYLLRSYLRS